jgi:hypothetical protein
MKRQTYKPSKCPSVVAAEICGAATPELVVTDKQYFMKSNR